MLPLIMGLGMAGLGAYRGKKQAERQQQIEADSRRMHAAQVRYSPWTNRQSFTPIQYAGADESSAMLGGALQGGMTGAAFGQGLGAAGADPAKKMSVWEQMQADEQKKKGMALAQQNDPYTLV